MNTIPDLKRIPAYILAGGQSSRFGQNKALALWQGRPLLEHVMSCLSHSFQTLKVIGKTPQQYLALGLDNLLDHPESQGKGPLAGLETALADAQHHNYAGYIYLASCDVLGVQTPDITTLYQALLSHDLPLSISYAHQPLWAFYHTDLYPQVQAQLQTGHFGLQRFLAQIQAPTLSDRTLAWQAINRPSDLAGLEP